MKLQFDSKKELTEFIANEVINTVEVMEILGCTRANVDDQIKRGKLQTIKDFKKDRLFYRSDVLERLKEITDYNSRKRTE